METAIADASQGAARSPSGLPALVGQKVREVDQVRVVEIREFLRHRAAVAEAGAALVLAHRPQQIVFALIGESRHLLAAGEVGIVTDAAGMAQSQLPAAIEALWIRSV